MTDGEWWRKSGPWSGRSGASGAGEGVPAVPAVPPAPPVAPPAAAADDSVYDPPAASAGGLRQVSLDLPGVAGPQDRAADALPPSGVQSHGPWSMTVFDFSDAPEPAPRPIPEQRAGEEAPPVEAAPVAGAGKKQRKQRAARAAPAAKAKPGPAKGARKPSPLILLSCGLLVGGAVSGFFPAMLAGWGLGYLSRQLSDLMRKFVIIGIPLATMSASTLFAMQHAKQAGGAGGAGGGAGVQTGAPLGQFSWSMAPGVLRTSAVITAVVLLLLSLRRRPS